LIHLYRSQLATKNRVIPAEKTVHIYNHRIAYGDLKALASLELPPRKDIIVLATLLNGILPGWNRNLPLLGKESLL
jgi:hypothetical protein